MMKKRISWFLVVAMMVTMLPITALASTEVTYTATVTDQSSTGDYNVGDTVTMDIVVTAEDAAATVAHFQFEPVYDSDLTLKTVTSTFGELDVGDNGVYVYTATGGTSQPVTNEGVVIATMTFQIAGDTTASSATVSLESLAISGTESSVTSTTAVSDTIHIYDIQVSFEDVTGATFTDVTSTDVTSYVKYGVAGLYTDRTDYFAFTFPTVSLASNYQFADDIWINQTDSTITYSDDAALVSATENLAESITVIPNVIKLTTIDFAVSGAGTVAGDSTIYEEVGDVITLPAVTPNSNYQFTGWTVSTGAAPTLSSGVYSYTVTDEDVTFTANFTPKSFAVSKVATDAIIKDVGGNTSLQYATYGTDYIFTAEPASDTVISSVAYTINGTTTIVYPDPEGNYTIPGTSITGTVSITAVATSYVTITFVAGTGTSLTGSTTAYAVVNHVGLYASTDDILSGEPNFTVPSASATSGYRIDQTALWSDGTDTYTTGDLSVDAAFATDTTLTAQAIAQFTVTFATDGNGSVGTTSVTVDDGTDISTLTMPSVTPNTGYVFSSWDITTGTVTSNTTITASFAKATYSATLSGVTVTDGVADGKVTHGEAVTFTTNAEESQIESIFYQVANGDRISVAIDLSGSYTIPAEAITGALSIWVVTLDSCTVDFIVAAGTTGAVSDGEIYLETTTVTENDSLTSSVVATAVALAQEKAASGYQFDGWSVDGEAKTSAEIEAMTITAYTEISAVYKVGEFDVSVTDVHITNIPIIAMGLQDFDFTPELTNGIITEVTATDESGNAITVTANGDGSYTIDADYVTGAITIDVQYFIGTLSFIYDFQYKGLTGDTKIAVVSGADDPGNDVYTIAGTKMFYRAAAAAYGDENGVYLLIINAEATADEVIALMDTTTGRSLTTIDDSGDVNGDGSVTVTDTAAIQTYLHDDTSASFVKDNSNNDTIVSASHQLERLQADVNGTATVSIFDIAEIFGTLS